MPYAFPISIIFFSGSEGTQREKDIGKVLGDVHCSKSKCDGNHKPSVVLLSPKPLEFCLPPSGSVC